MVLSRARERWRGGEGAANFSAPPQWVRRQPIICTADSHRQRHPPNAHHQSLENPLRHYMSLYLADGQHVLVPCGPAARGALCAAGFPPARMMLTILLLCMYTIRTDARSTRQIEASTQHTQHSGFLETFSIQHIRGNAPVNVYNQ